MDPEMKQNRAVSGPVSAEGFFLLLRLCIAVGAGLILAWALTEWGVIINSDSEAYHVMSRCLSEDRASFDAVPDCKTLALHFPPFYPFLISLLRGWSESFMERSVWLNILLYSGSVFVSGSLFKRLTGFSLMGPAGAFFVASSPVVVRAYTEAMTEGVFIFFTLSGALFFLRYLEKGGYGPLLTTGVLTGLSFVSRFAGLTTILSMVATIIICSRRDKKPLFPAAFLFILTALMPMGVWLVRNLLDYGLVLDRIAVFHPPGWSAWREASGVFCRWVMSPVFCLFTKEIVLLAAFCGFVFFSLRLGKALSSERIKDAEPFFLWSFMAVLGVLFYLTGLVVTVSWLDGYMTLSARYLLPVYIFAMILVPAGVISRIIRCRVPGSVTVFLGKVLLAYWLLFNCLASFTWLWQQHARGNGYASRDWWQSPAMQELCRLSDRHLIFTNLKAAAVIHCGPGILEIPWFSDPMNSRLNGRYSQELAEMVRQMKDRNGRLVYFDKAPRDLPIEPVQLLKARLSLGMVAEFPDGAVYVVE